MKEAYAIFLSVKKLSFSLVVTSITLRSDHLSLMKFHQRMTLNAKVNIRGVKLSDYNILLKFLKGVKNILADTVKSTLPQPNLTLTGSLSCPTNL